MASSNNYRQIFICDDNSGMFVSLERLAPTPNFRPTRTPTAPTTKATLLPDAVRSQLGLEGHKNSGSCFQKGDRVVINNKDQIPIHGTQ